MGSNQCCSSKRDDEGELFVWALYAPRNGEQICTSWWEIFRFGNSFEGMEKDFSDARPSFPMSKSARQQKRIAREKLKRFGMKERAKRLSRKNTLDELSKNLQPATHEL